MRYVAVVLVLLAAAALTTRFLQKAAGRQPDKSDAGRKSEASSGSDRRGKSEAEDQPQTGGKAESGEQSPSDQDPKAEQSAKPDEEPLLLLDNDPPLLLDDGEESGAGKPMADNSRCYHCHLDYVKEQLGVIHAKANVGCADCHGNCDAHIADESWASGGNGTPPEKMYPREKINPLCFGCHAKDKLDKSEHEDLLAGSAKEKYCTDCHGDHRMPKRKCKWK